MKLTIENLPMYCIEEGECLLWKQGVQSNGYPQARLDGRTQLVRRYVYVTLMGKELIRGRAAVAKCGNIRCVAPGCIVSRTFGKVLSDCYANGSRSASTGYLSMIKRMEKQGRTKLDFEKAREIRTRVESTDDLAREFGCSPSAIKEARSGRSWRNGHSASHPGASVFSWASA